MSHEYRPYRGNRSNRANDIEQSIPHDDNLRYGANTVQQRRRVNDNSISVNNDDNHKTRRSYSKIIASTVVVVTICIICTILYVTRSSTAGATDTWLPNIHQFNVDSTNNIKLQSHTTNQYILLQSQYTTLQQQYDALNTKYNELLTLSSHKQPVVDPQCTICEKCTVCEKCDNNNKQCPPCSQSGNIPLQPLSHASGYPLPSCRGIPVPVLPSTDLSFNPQFDVHTHDITWNVCRDKQVKHSRNQPDSIQYCDDSAMNEHYWQLEWYNRMDGKNKTHIIKRDTIVNTPNCVQIPPVDYQWPDKYPVLPADLLHDNDPIKRSKLRSAHKQYESYESNQHTYYHWPNLRVQSIQELRTFNQGTPKNLYHFDAYFYDNQQLDVVNVAAQYIPFAQKIRLMLDMGSGGASLGLLIQRLYDVHVINTIFADWPYCEYISDRGGICMLLDAMNSMPFSKYTFDIVHAAWLYHDKKADVLWDIFNEQNRVIRPGGYLWWAGGFSKQQINAIELYAELFGYHVLLNDKQPQPPGQYFGTYSDIPYEITWNAIWIKPIKAVIHDHCDGKMQVENIKNKFK